MHDSPHLSLAIQSYAASEPYLAALKAVLSPRVRSWSISFEIDIPPFSTFERVLQTATTCQRLGIGFYLDDLCMMADHLKYHRRWLEPPELDQLVQHCPDAFLGVRLHPEAPNHEITPNHYRSFLRWNQGRRREIQLVVHPSRWAGSDWERTTSVQQGQPWTVLRLISSLTDGNQQPQRLRRLAAGAAGTCFRLDHWDRCEPAALREHLVSCLQDAPSCLAFYPANMLVDNPGSAKLPVDLHRWPLFNTVDALRPGERLVVTPCGEIVFAALAV